ncbi:MAG: metallophosphoesterase, partial [Phycisphaeraceae bacterium]|nr:metallophosphoesterase [Phycisphaeraceae bacterium]
SWPGGLGAGPGSDSDWARCLTEYGLTEDEAATFEGNPIDRLAPLARADVPLLNVCGATDKVVPIAENTDILRQRYEALGGRIRVISKPENGHHPHSLKDPTLIVNFVLQHTQGANDFITPRATLHSSARRFRERGQGRVAFIGGSITEMNGYRPKVCAMLQQQFPDTKFDFVNAGISSTCSTTGAFRLQQNVLSKGQVDLLFVEFAVNDDQDANHTTTECIRGMEGIARQALAANPVMDIVFLYTTNPHFVEQYQQGNTPHQMEAHETVAQAYGLCSVNFAADVAMRLGEGEFDWKTFGGVHPADFGNTLYANSISTLLKGQWAGTDTQKISRAPSDPLDPYAYAGGSLTTIQEAHLGRGWQITTPDWKALRGGTRAQYNQIPLLTADTPGAELTLHFTGTAVGLYVVAGPDSGQVDYSIDEGPVQRADLYHRYSAGLHYPRTCMLSAELTPGDHHLTLQVADTHHDKSQGHAIRIVAFSVNTGALRPLKSPDTPLSTVAGPYLQNAQATAMSIQWLTNHPCASWVEYGQPGEPFQRAVPSQDGLVRAAETTHRVTIKGLQPGTTYRYRTVSKEIIHFAAYHVSFGDKIYSDESIFTTLDPSQAECNFVVLNDIHGNDSLFIKLMAMADKTPYDLVFLNGDIVGDIDHESQFVRHILRTTESFASRIPFVLVRGNHETRGQFARQLPEYVTRQDNHYYGAFTHGPVRFVMLDGGEDKEDSHWAYSGLGDFDAYREEQTLWLKQEIQSTAFKAATFRIVLMHIPLYGSSNGHGPSDCRSQWADLINQADVDLMISGHTHRQRIVAPRPGLNPYP